MKDTNNSWSHLLSLTRKWPHRSATKCNDELPPPHRSPSLEVRKCREHISSWIALRIENDALQLAHWAQDRNGSRADYQRRSAPGRLYPHIAVVVAAVPKWSALCQKPTSS